MGEGSEVSRLHKTLLKLFKQPMDPRDKRLRGRGGVMKLHPRGEGVFVWGGGVRNQIYFLFMVIIEPCHIHRGREFN